VGNSLLFWSRSILPFVRISLVIMLNYVLVVVAVVLEIVVIVVMVVLVKAVDMLKTPTFQMLVLS